MLCQVVPKDDQIPHFLGVRDDDDSSSRSLRASALQSVNEEGKKAQNDTKVCKHRDLLQ